MTDNIQSVEFHQNDNVAKKIFLAKHVKKLFTKKIKTKHVHHFPLTNCSKNIICHKILVLEKYKSKPNASHHPK